MAKLLSRAVALPLAFVQIIATLCAARAGESDPFLITGTIHNAPIGTLTVSLRNCQSATNCDAVSVVSSEANRSKDDPTAAVFVLWGPIDSLRPGGLLKLIVAAPRDTFSSAPFRLNSDNTYDVDVSPGVGIKSIQHNLYLASTIPFFYVTDRLEKKDGFDNKPDPAGAISIGTFVAHVDRVFCGGGSCSSDYLCKALSDWTCEANTQTNDDVFRSELTPSMRGFPALTRDLLEATSAPGRSSILVYVHGFNTSFEGAVSYGARLSLEAERLPHVTVIYSWPSAADGKAYATDQERSYNSAVNGFVQLLNSLEPLVGPGASPKRNIIIVAHSMGTHVVTEGIAKWVSLQKRPVADTFTHVVFFAADEGVDDWNSRYGNGKAKEELVRAAATRLTIYQSKNDAALISSKCVMHDDFRLGQPDSNPPIGPDIDIRDVSSSAGYNSGGHGYLVQSADVASDFSSLLAGGNALADELKQLPWLGPNNSGLSSISPIAANKIPCKIADGIFGS